MVRQEIENIERAFEVKNRYVKTLEKRNEQLERLLESSWTDEQVKVARARYNKNPKTVTRSDDSYSMWQDTMSWNELSIYQKIPYIYSEDEL